VQHSRVGVRRSGKNEERAEREASSTYLANVMHGVEISEEPAPPFNQLLGRAPLQPVAYQVRDELPLPFRVRLYRTRAAVFATAFSILLLVLGRPALSLHGYLEHQLRFTVAPNPSRYVFQGLHKSMPRRT
jgi:hypothetical protein